MVAETAANAGRRLLPLYMRRPQKPDNIFVRFAYAAHAFGQRGRRTKCQVEGRSRTLAGERRPCTSAARKMGRKPEASAWLRSLTARGMRPLARLSQKHFLSHGEISARGCAQPMHNWSGRGNCIRPGPQRSAVRKLAVAVNEVPHCSGATHDDKSLQRWFNSRLQCNNWHTTLTLR
jgi:hypothetical protein